jgi:hypothetical protein
MLGNVSFADELDLSKGTKGIPVRNTSVIIKKKKAAQQQKSTQAEEAIAFVITDDLGNYEFEDIPDGEYILHVDMPGLPMIETYDVLIEGKKIIYGLDFVVNKKGIEATGTVDVEKTEASYFSVFPNPGQGQLHLHLPDPGDYYVRVYNSLGALMEQISLPGVSGTTSLDLTSLTQGIYFLTIEGNDLRETIKYMRR